MERRTILVVSLILVTVPLTGCLGEAAEPIQEQATIVSPSTRTHVLDGALEPDDLLAPTFEVLGTLAAAGPGYGGGEPSIWAALDGTLYVAFPGCDKGPAPTASWLVAGECQHGPIYRSTDDGASWTRLNDEATGRLTDDGPSANGDNDVTTDAAGTVYASNLGGGIQVYASADRGETWRYAGDVVPDEHWADRQWMAAAGEGHLLMTWMGGKDDHRQVAVSTTWNGGENWSEVEYVGEAIGWLGPVQFDVDGQTAYIPFTEPSGDGADLLVARTLDGGLTWEVLDTGHRSVRAAPVHIDNQWSGVLMAPALDVTGDGTVVYVWAEEVPSPVQGRGSMGAVVKLIASKDRGETWNKPVVVSERPSAIMPWVTGGAGDRVAITYFASDLPLDTDYVAASWDVQAVVVDGVGTSEPAMVRSLVDEGVHQGGICSRGGACLISGSDRALLDFFESDLLPDGRLVVTYPADPVQGGKFIEIRVAIQDGGSPLSVLP